MNNTKIFTNPFSEPFLDTWELWKQYRLEEHGFQYKGVISEQMAINRLVEVADKDEEKAVRIVKQSISRGWMDFYQLHQSNPNGKSKEGKPSDLRERVRRAVNKKFGDGTDKGGESHLKAV